MTPKNKKKVVKVVAYVMGTIGYALLFSSSWEIALGVFCINIAWECFKLTQEI